MITADKSEHLGVVFNMQEIERSFQVFSDKHPDQTANLQFDREAAIDRMVRDVVRVQCSKVLVSPEVWNGCVDRISVRNLELGETRPMAEKLIVRGVPAERCETLTGTEYALMPVVRTISSPWGLDAE